MSARRRQADRKARRRAKQLEHEKRINRRGEEWIDAQGIASLARFRQMTRDDQVTEIGKLTVLRIWTMAPFRADPFGLIALIIAMVALVISLAAPGSLAGANALVIFYLTLVMTSAIVGIPVYFVRQGNMKLPAVERRLVEFQSHLAPDRVLQNLTGELYVGTWRTPLRLDLRQSTP